MRKSVLFAIMLSTSVPSYAVKETLNVLVEMKTSGIYNQENVLKQFPDVLKEEGLSHLLSSPNGEKVEKMELSNSSHLKTSEDLNKALIEKFISLKRQEMGKVLGTTGLPFALDCGLTTFFGFSGLLGNIGGGMALFSAMKSVKEFISDLVSGATKICDLETDELFKYEIQYVLKKRFLPETLQAAIENRFSTARKDPKNLQETLNDYLPIALNLPTRTKEPSSDFEDKLRKLTEGYIIEGEKSLGDILVDVATSHYSNYMKGIGKNSASKRILYLVGLAGVGKTYIAEALAEALELPFENISLSGGASKVFGDKNNPGEFLQKIAKPGSVLNSVSFYDEANHALNTGIVSKKIPGTDMISSGKTRLSPNSEQASWLKFFDPVEKETFLPFLNAEVDDSHRLKVCAGNDLPYSEALKNRMVKVKILGVKPEFKRAIVEKHILPKLLKRENSTVNLTMSDINMQEVEKIIQNVENMVEISKKEKEAREEKKKTLQQNPLIFQFPEEEEEEVDVGFRTIKEDLETYINKIRLERIKKSNKEKAEKLKEETEKSPIVELYKGTSYYESDKYVNGYRALLHMN